MLIDHELNLQALDNPHLGDYWHEQFCGVLLVIDFDLESNRIGFVDKKNYTTNNLWYWDEDQKPIFTPLRTFRRKLRYEPDNIYSNCWCDVIRSNPTCRNEALDFKDKLRGL